MECARWRARRLRRAFWLRKEHLCQLRDIEKRMMTSSLLPSLHALLRRDQRGRLRATAERGDVSQSELHMAHHALFHSRLQESIRLSHLADAVYGAITRLQVSLLLRLYDAQNGAILIDGKPLSSFDKRALRAVSATPSDCFLRVNTHTSGYRHRTTGAVSLQWHDSRQHRTRPRAAFGNGRGW